MNILYTENKARHIVYNKLNSSRKEAPCVIFHHGLMSNMNGFKALHLEKHCKEKDYNYIRFDNFGHGEASGEFTDQTISSWLEGLNLVVDQLASDAPVLLVGSSMGGWITMLKAMSVSKNIIGIVGIAAAPDFTEELMWDQLSIEQKDQLVRNGFIEITGGSTHCNHSYPINYQLITDARKHLLLSKDRIEIPCPVHLIHGSQDSDVPCSISERVASKIVSDEIVLKIIKSADHLLSRDQDLRIICNSIEEILAGV